MTWANNIDNQSQDISKRECNFDILGLFKHFGKSFNKPISNFSKKDFDQDVAIILQNYTDKHKCCPAMQSLLRGRGDESSVDILLQVIYTNLLIKNYSSNSQDLYQVRSEDTYNLTKYQESEANGNKVALKGFVSVTGSALDEFQNSPVCLLLKIPKNVKAMNIKDKSLYPHENETLLASNTELKVFKIISWVMQEEKKYVVSGEVASDKVSDLTQINSSLQEEKKYVVFGEVVSDKVSDLTQINSSLQNEQSYNSNSNLLTNSTSDYYQNYSSADKVLSIGEIYSTTFPPIDKL